MKKECENFDVCKRRYGEKTAIKIYMRIEQIKAVDTVEELIKFKIGRCHSLDGDRKGQYAMELNQPYRLIFKVEDEEIQLVKILEVKDYH